MTRGSLCRHARVARDSGEQMPLRSKLRQEFTVDSALLRELGERLVGAPHIALAELIKNAYDADATRVTVEIDVDVIRVADDGHGMSFKDFRDLWMRVGSAHKRANQISPGGRPLTGSKGVGRLSAQFLGSQLEMRTVSAKTPSREVLASIDWEAAVTAGDLTRATAEYEQRRPSGEFPNGSRNGTEVVISELKQPWTQDAFRNLAREIWFLQPPFAGALGDDLDADQDFRVELLTPAGEDAEEFETQLRRVLDLWMARIVGRLEVRGSGSRRRGTVKYRLRFRDSARSQRGEYELPPSEDERPTRDADLSDLGREALLSSASFDIRVFDLRGKQRFGINVEQARSYLNEFGGVHVYDGGFRIPFSGPEADWLRVEFDHAHRLSRSQFLPAGLTENLNFDAMTHLPTNSRLFGVVQIYTSQEAAASRADKRRGRSQPPHLQIQVSRDRLVRNQAFDQLRWMVRWAIDRYALERGHRRWQQVESDREVRSPAAAARMALEVLEEAADSIPKRTSRQLRSLIGKIEVDARSETQAQRALTTDLATFASAGVVTLAYDHEVAKQVVAVRGIARRLRMASQGTDRSAIAKIAVDLGDWARRAEGTRSLLKHLVSSESRETQARFRLHKLLKETLLGSEYLLRDVEVEYADVPKTFRLPRAPYAAWVSVFQNVLVNAANAIHAIEGRQTGLISISAAVRGERRAIRIQDDGAGVDLDGAAELFDPFVRRLKISPARRKLAAGGSGLGLALVRIIVSDAGASVRFVEPDPGFATCLEFSWDE